MHDHSVQSLVAKLRKHTPLRLMHLQLELLYLRESTLGQVVTVPGVEYPLPPQDVIHRGVVHSGLQLDQSTFELRDVDGQLAEELNSVEYCGSVNENHRDAHLLTLRVDTRHEDRRHPMAEEGQPSALLPRQEAHHLSQRIRGEGDRLRVLLALDSLITGSHAS
jgi:hypothetical protein